MLKKLVNPDDASDALSAAGAPTRIITYAWGEKYLDALLSLNFPALLAPGNLPYLAAKVPCEVVILTEERFFPKVTLHPVVVRMQSHCDVRLISLDDLISVPDKYGMALTYALHRGFADLGPAMTDSWQIFLNADFILADGSLRRLLPHLAHGEHIIASPSYCVNAEAVIPELRRRIDPKNFTLALSPREMADLVLQYRHNTVRGKTFNQRSISMRYMDQFYWEVDRNTLVGYQMPVAIIGLRPQRHVSEPNAYWDHGLMREFCPDASVHVLGDSDDFLMLELRGEDTARDQTSVGWPSPAEIASRMIVFLTPYQQEYLQFPLTLHSADLPADTEECRARLKARVDEVFVRVPKVLPGHHNHPQWQYHQRAFIRARHDKLSERLGLRTARVPPPNTFSELDQVWWKLDGLQKSQPRQREKCVAEMTENLAWLDEVLAGALSNRPHGKPLSAKDEEKLREDIARKLLAPRLAKQSDLTESGIGDADQSAADQELLAELTALVDLLTPRLTNPSDLTESGDGATKPPNPEQKLLEELSALVDQDALAETEFATTMILPRSGPDHSTSIESSESPLDQSLRTLLERRQSEFAKHDGLERLRLAREMVKQHYERRLLRLDADSETKRQHLQAEYDRLLPKAPSEAGIPHIDLRFGPVTAVPPSGSLPVRIAKEAYYRAFGKVPRVTRLNPLWASLRHLVRIADEAATAGARNVFVIGPQDTPIAKLADPFSGKCARIPLENVLSDNFALAIEQTPDIDLCICQLEYSQLHEFPKIVKAVTPCIRSGGKIVGFYLNTEQTMSPNDPRFVLALSGLTSSARIHYAGSTRTAELMNLFRSLRAGSGSRLLRGARFALSLMLIAPLAMAANRAEDTLQGDGASILGDNCTSITLEVTVLHAAPQAPEIANEQDEASRH